MQFFTFNNLVDILKIFLILTVSGFSLYFPLYYFFKSKEIASKFSIPLSFSIEIIFGYIFYSLSIIHYFPISYFSSVIILNLYLLRKHAFKPFSLLKKAWSQLKDNSVYFIIAIPILYSRFFDAITNIAPGNNDTFNHLNFIKDLANNGFLNNPYYAPGFHLLLYPLTFFVSYENIYRFTGPVIGCLTIVSMFLLFKSKFKKSSTKIFFLILTILPIFNQLTLQTISLFSSALTFIFIASFIYLISKPKELNEKSTNTFYLILITALSITVPYLLVQLIPIVFIIFLPILFKKDNFILQKKKFIFGIFFITCFGFLLAFGHVYLQTNIINKNLGFPKINTINNDGTLSSNYQNNINEIQKAPQNILITKYVTPMLNIGFDIIKVKNIRPANSILSIGAYLWIIFSILLLFYSIKRKEKLTANLAIFSIIFGIATQTGILEMSFYRGRAGWYLLQLALLGTTFIFDLLFTKKLKSITIIFCLLTITTSFFYPPTFYRSYFNDPFAFAYKIKEKYPKQKVSFLTNQNQISLLSENFSILPLKTESFNEDLPDLNFIIFNNNFFIPNPVLSQAALSTDKNFTRYNEIQQENINSQKSNMASIKSDPHFNNYKLYYENSDITVYISKKF